MSWRAGESAGSAIRTSSVNLAGPTVVAATSVATETTTWGMLRASVNEGLGALRGHGFTGHKRAARLWFCFQCGAKLGNFFFDEQAVTALRQPFQGEGAQGDAFEFFDGMFFGEKHAAKNVLPGVL